MDTCLIDVTVFISDGWEVIYFNDKLVLEGIKIRANLLAVALEGKFIHKVETYYISDETLVDKYEGFFPHNLKDINLNDCVALYKQI